MADFCKIDFFKWTLSFTFVYAVSLPFSFKFFNIHTPVKRKNVEVEEE